MFYIIKSTINLKNPSEVTHEIIHIDYDQEGSISNFETLMETQNFDKHKIKKFENKTTFYLNDIVVTIQIHEHVDIPSQSFDDFIDDSDCNNIRDESNDEEEENNIIENFLNLQNKMGPDEIDGYMRRVNTIINKNKIDETDISSQYNKLIKKNSHLLETSEKSLTLQF